MLSYVDVQKLYLATHRDREYETVDTLPQTHSVEDSTIVASAEAGSSSESTQPSDGHSSVSQSSSATTDGETTDPPRDNDSLDQDEEQGAGNNKPNKEVALNIVPPSQLKGFVLFGVHGSKRLRRGKTRMAQIDVETHTDDDSFFDELVVQYKALRGYMRWIFSIWCFRTCEFVMVHTLSVSVHIKT